MPFDAPAALRRFSHSLSALASSWAPSCARECRWLCAGLFAATLLPLVWLALHAGPQLVDFCASRFMQADVGAALRQQFDIYGHQFLGRSLNLLPLVLVSAFSLDYFYIYSAFILGGLCALALFAAWISAQLLPTARGPQRLLTTVALLLALAANAPSVRELLFSLPSLFTYALPGIGLAAVFMTLYRALAASRDFTWPERILLLLATPIGALSNEWSGLALMAIVLCAFIARLRLAPESPAPVLHAALLGMAVLGAILLLLGPQQPIFTLDNLGMGLIWSLAYTPEFFLLRLPLPGTIGWFLLLALSYRPELQSATLSERHRQLLAFTLVSLLSASFIAFAFGYLPAEGRLPARGQNELYILVIVALSLALCLLVPIWRFRLARLCAARWPTATAERWVRLPGKLLLLALLLGLCSPGVLAALWEAPNAPAFRDEARTRLALMMAPPPTGPEAGQVQVPRLAVQPGLLFDRDMSDNPDAPRNACAAEFFRLKKVAPQAP